MFTGLGSFLVALHQLAFAVDVGFDKLYAAGVLGMGAFLSLPGVIITGTLSDYIGRELSAIVTYGTSILGVAFALMITAPDQHLLLWLHACFFGLTWGARGPAITAKTADLFPGPNLGAILGVITIGTGLGAAERLLAGRLRVRHHRQLPGGVQAVDRVLCRRKRRVLGAAPAAGNPRLEWDEIAFAQPSHSSSLFDCVIQTFGDSAYSHHALVSSISGPRSRPIPLPGVRHAVSGDQRAPAGTAEPRRRGPSTLLDLGSAADRQGRGPVGPRQGRPRRRRAVRRRVRTRALHAHLNAWADIIPATFQVHALIDPASAAVPGAGQAKGRSTGRSRSRPKANQGPETPGG